MWMVCPVVLWVRSKQHTKWLGNSYMTTKKHWSGSECSHSIEIQVVFHDPLWTLRLSLANYEEEICILSLVWTTPYNFPTKAQAACSGNFTLSTVDVVWSYTTLMCWNIFTDPYSTQQSVQPSISFHKNFSLVSCNTVLTLCLTAWPKKKLQKTTKI